MKRIFSFLRVAFAASNRVPTNKRTCRFRIEALTVGVLLLAGVVTNAQAPPAIEQIIKNAQAAMLSPVPYQVAVSQTVQRADLKALTDEAALAQAIQSFTLAWDPATGLATMPADAKAAVAAAEKSGVQVSVRTDRLLADLLNHPQVDLGMEELNGRPCYKLTVNSPKGTGCAVWIDAERWYVPAVNVFIENVPFAEVQIEYRRQNGLWLPSKVVIAHAGDGSCIIQSFGEYNFGPVPPVEKAAASENAAAISSELFEVPRVSAVPGSPGATVQPHGSLNALRGFPAYSIDTGWVGANVGVGAYLRLGAGFGGTLAKVSMNGQGNLVPACLRGSGELWFQGGAGEVLMDFGLQTVAQYRIVISMPWPILDIDTTGNLPLLPNVDLRFDSRTNTTSYLLGSKVNLSDSLSNKEIIDYGFDIPLVASIGVGASVSANCSNDVEGRRLATSAGTFTNEQQSMTVALGGSSVTVSNIVETYRTTLKFSLTPNGTFHVSLGPLEYSVVIPVVTIPINLSGADFDSSPKRSISFEACPAPQPFTPLKATYNGLFAEPKVVSHTSSGGFTLTTTDKGKFSAKLLVGSSRYSMSGSLDNNGHATVTVDRKNLSAVTVELQMNAASGGDNLVGLVSDGVWTADLYADRAVFDGKSSVSPQAGQYTVVVAANCPNANEPNGDSWGAVTVDRAGKVRLTGALGDGTKITQASAVSRNGTWPLYVPLHKGQGSIVSWVALSTNAAAAEDLCGDLTWTEPAQSKSKYYPAGFITQKAVSGSRYVRPAKGQQVLNLSEADLILSGGHLKQALTNHVTIGANSQVTDANGKKLNLKFTPTTGLFKGSVPDPDTSKPIPFSGAVLQKQNVAVGSFQGTDRYGRVALQGH